jgi:hypothetical protein
VWIGLRDGRLSLTGQDLGGAMMGADEYEYFITVEPGHFDAIRAALRAEPDADIIDTMCAHAETIFMKGETTWLDSFSIPHEFANWVHFDD